MFETADRPQTVDPAFYDAQEPLLRQALLQTQQAVRESGLGVILIFAGLEKAGTGDTVNLLNAWMDPRWLDTVAYGPPTEEERQRPRMWRDWRDLPPRGRIGLRLGAWYTAPVFARVDGSLDAAGFAHALEEIADHERLLAVDGMLIIKFWLHLSRASQKARLEALSADPLQSWRVTRLDWAQWERYDAIIEAGEQVILRTSTGRAPWHIVEGSDPNYRGLRVANIIRDAISTRLAAQRLEALTAAATRVSAAPASAEAPDVARAEAQPDGDGSAAAATEGEAPRIQPVRPRAVLHDLEMGEKPPRAVYNRELAHWQGRLSHLHRVARTAGISTVMAFEGWDAGGKGGAIRRVTAALDARHVRVIPIAAPTEEERARHYLWRFWRHLGPSGSVVIFDRSWYGRVLVERVEGFATTAEWQRAYAEINHFEQQLVEHGIALVKFFLHITPEEQLERFEERANTPHKRWKITDEDWRNRARWPDYEIAVHDMVERTSTRAAPWTLVPANHKRRARLHVLETVCTRLMAALEARGVPLP